MIASGPAGAARRCIGVQGSAIPLTFRIDVARMPKSRPVGAGAWDAGLAMAETTFGITYDGPALAEGRMPVRELAPSLLAFGDLFRLASREAYPDLPPPSLAVKAPERGSFKVQIVLVAAPTWEQVVDLLNADGTTALNNLLGLIVSGSAIGTGLFRLIQNIGNRKLLREEPTNDPERMRIILDDQTVIEAPVGTVRIYRNRKARKAARDAVGPLKHPEVTQVRFETGDPNLKPAILEVDDVPAFDLAAEAEDEEIVSESEIDLILDVFGPQLKPGSERKWSFGGLGATFEARIEDPEFAEKVANHEEEFGVGDQLDATLEVVQKRDPDSGTIKDTRRVVRVNRVIKGPKQLPLGSSTPETENDPPNARP